MISNANYEVKIPASLCDVLRRSLPDVDVTRVLWQPRVLGHEAEVERVGRVEATERHVLQAVEEVLRGVLRQLERRGKKEVQTGVNF